MPTTKYTDRVYVKETHAWGKVPKYKTPMKGELQFGHQASVREITAEVPWGNHSDIQQK